MAEAVGVFASATQLAHYGIKISSGLAEICRRLRDSPEELRSFARVLYELIETARSIQSFHQSVVSSRLAFHLQSTLREAEKLKCIVELVATDYSRGSIARRFWKAARGSQERKILQGFKRLDDEKSSLSICTGAVTINQLAILGYNTSAMDEVTTYCRNVIPEEHEDSPGGDSEEQQMNSRSSMCTVVRNNTNSSCTTYTSQERITRGIVAQNNIQASGSGPFRHQTADSNEPGPSRASPHANHTTRHRYGTLNVTATKSRIINGNLGNVHVNTSETGNTYGNMSIGGSDSSIINGDVVMDDIKDFFGH